MPEGCFARVKALPWNELLGCAGNSGTLNAEESTGNLGWNVEVFGTGGSWPTLVAGLRDVLIRFWGAGMSICAGLFPEVF